MLIVSASGSLHFIRFTSSRRVAQLHLPANVGNATALCTLNWDTHSLIAAGTENGHVLLLNIAAISNDCPVRCMFSLSCFCFLTLFPVRQAKSMPHLFTAEKVDVVMFYDLTADRHGKQGAFLYPVQVEEIKSAYPERRFKEIPLSAAQYVSPTTQDFG